MILSLLTSGYSFDIILILLVAILVSATVSIVMHEIAHGFVALKCGDPSAKNANRLTLNPLAHFDIVGIILMLFFGFGWAKPVPINPDNFKKRTRGIVLVSIAGVVTNLLIFGLALLLLHLIYPALIALLTSKSAVRLLGYLFYYMLVYFITFNLMLAFFNILPIAPLDGFNFVNALLPYGNKYSVFMKKYGWYLLLGLILISNILNYVGLKQFNVFYQVQQLAYKLIDLVTGGVFG